LRASGLLFTSSQPIEGKKVVAHEKKKKKKKKKSGTQKKKKLRQSMTSSYFCGPRKGLKVAAWVSTKKLRQIKCAFGPPKFYPVDA
jgi:hypothetical protein